MIGTQRTTIEYWSSGYNKDPKKFDHFQFLLAVVSRNNWYNWSVLAQNSIFEFSTLAFGEPCKEMPFEQFKSSI